LGRWVGEKDELARVGKGSFLVDGIEIHA